jgi:hypothetical protein
MIRGVGLGQVQREARTFAMGCDWNLSRLDSHFAISNAGSPWRVILASTVGGVTTRLRRPALGVGVRATYLCAGVVQNLELDAQGRLGLAFTRSDWPKPRAGSAQISWSLLLAAIPLVLVAAYILVGFVGWHF